MPEQVVVPDAKTVAQQAQAMLRPSKALSALMSGPDGVKSLSMLAVEAAWRLVWAENPYLAQVWVELHGLSGEPAHLVEDVAAAHGLTISEAERIDQRVAARLRELITQQPENWSGVPASVKDKLLDLGVDRPSRLSQVNAQRITSGKGWDIGDIAKVNTLIQRHGFPPIEELAARDPQTFL